jgi:hypothetical protein
MKHTKVLVSRVEGRVGTGDWEGFDVPLELIREAAADWRSALGGIERPWLCWNVNSSWCLLQQKLIREVGWTPVVGFDPRVGPPETVPGAVLLDFNARLQLPMMWMHFPLEFVFLFAPRLAFWHSDLLVRMDKLRDLAGRFAGLREGETAAVLDRGGRRNFWNFKTHKYYELVGCTTRGASESQFRHGAGWWRHIECHPNCPSEKERQQRSTYYWEHGLGLMYWKKNYGGTVHAIDWKYVEEGHCTSMNYRGYKRLSGPEMYGALGDELDENYALHEVVRKLGLDRLL